MEPVPGFRRASAMFEPSKKIVERAVGSGEFKTEMAAMRGTSQFAQFVNGLK